MTHRIIILLLISLLFFSCNEDESKTEPIALQTVLTYENIEDFPLENGSRYTHQNSTLQYTGWGVYEDIIFPGTTILWDMQHVNSPALNGQSLECAITGGDRYNNAFYTNTVAMRWEGEDWEYDNLKQLIYELDFYIDGNIDCQNPNDSQLEGLEFTWQHIELPLSYGFGVQWSKGGEWRFWNDEKDTQGNTLAWQSFSPDINTCIEGNTWHHLKLIGDIVGDGIKYVSMELNGQFFDLSSATVGRSEVPSSWVENFLQVGMQINGNEALDTSHGHGTDPISVYLDNVTLIGKK